MQGTAYTNTYTNTLVRYAGYEVATQSGTSTVLQPGQTNYQYDVNGNLTGVTDSTDSANNRSFVNDVTGQILQKTQGSAVERELIANGNLIGTTGMGTDPQSPTAGRTPTFVDLTNFDPTYRPINANYPAPTPGAYAVNAGDTLQSIAQGAYGDSKLWYLIADANGLSSNNELRVGQTLNVPNRVTDIHNSAGDFKPYDAGAVVGSTTPNLPDPPAQSGGGCGAILGIIILVIVVVVTVIAQQYEALPQEANTFGFTLAGTTAAGTGTGLGAGVVGANAFGFTMAGTSMAGTLAAAAAAGAAADAATQLVGDALGTHHGFDLLETVEAAGTSMILPGAGSGVGTSTMAQIGEQALRGALVNAATQGIRLALHQQESFNWGELALSAAAAPVAAEAGKLVGDGLSHLNLPSEFSQVTKQVMQGMAANVTTQLATGGKVDFAAVASDAFGNELGDGALTEAESVGQQLQSLAQAQQSTAQANGFDTNAAYAQLVDAFSAASDPASSSPMTLLAANDLTQPGQPVVATDAGGGDGSTARWDSTVNGVEWGRSQIGRLPDGTMVYAHTAQPDDPTLRVDGTGLSETPSIPGYTYAGSAGSQIFYSPDDPNASLDQQRAARIDLMQADAAHPADVQDGWVNGVPNILVTGVGQASAPAPVVPSNTPAPQGPMELSQFSSVSAMWHALTQEKNAEATAGTYDAFSQMRHAVTDNGSALDRAVRLANVMMYQRPDAQEQIARMFPPPTPLEATLNNISDNPFSAVAATVVYENGGSNEAAYKASQSIGAAWGIVGAAGFELPEAPPANRVASTSRTGLTEANGSNLVDSQPPGALRPHLRAAEKGYPGVQITQNGGPTFVNSAYLFPVEDGQLNVVNMPMTGVNAGLNPTLNDGVMELSR